MREVVCQRSIVHKYGSVCNGFCAWRGVFLSLVVVVVTRMLRACAMQVNYAGLCGFLADVAAV